jgi:DNA (cytosine-5)-methyltransferase 1
MNELALFAGAGGGILGGKLLGWRTVCAVEWDSYAASVLVARQNDKTLDPFPIWDDVQTFDGRPWRGRVDVISGGFPCQDISCAGKGAGIDGERSGMWGHMARIVSEVRPEYVFVENSPMLVGRGLTRVLSDLAKMGYDARWGIVGAHHVAAPHKRDRIWIVAHSNLPQCEGGRVSSRIQEKNAHLGCGSKYGNACQDVADSDNNGLASTEKPRSTVKGSNNCSTGSQQTSKSERLRSSRSNKDVADSEKLQCDGSDNNARNLSQSKTIPESRNDGGESDVADSKMPDDSPMQDQKRHKKRTQGEFGRSSGSGSGGKQWWASEPELGRVANGVAHRVDRLKCIGNGQVPHVAAYAWRLLGGPIK